MFYPNGEFVFGYNVSVHDLYKTEAIVTGLSRVSWEKVDVSFHTSRQRFAAHNVIQVSLPLSFVLSRSFCHEITCIISLIL